MWISYIVLLLSVVLLLSALFFALFPEHILSIWRRRIWFYLSVGLCALIGIVVLAMFMVQRCDRNRWTQHELQVGRCSMFLLVSQFSDILKIFTSFTNFEVFASFLIMNTKTEIMTY